MQCLLRCADSKSHARSHSIVPWGLVVRASLSSQSKSNSCIPREAFLSDRRGFPPCLETTSGLKEINYLISSHLSVPMGGALYYLGLWNGAWPRRVCKCLRKCTLHEPEDAIRAGFLLCSFSRHGWRTQTLISMWPADPVLSCEGWSLLKRQCWNAFAHVSQGICPGDTRPLLSLELSLTSENSLDSWQNCWIYQQRNSLFSK